MRRFSSVVAVAALLVAGQAVAQASPQLEVEITDASGTLLPNARIELLAYAERGLQREWLVIHPALLGEGIHLLRFSHVGYHPTVMSVPIRKSARTAVRVRLDADRGPLDGPIAPIPVDADGVLIDKSKSTDFIGARRVFDRETIERANVESIADLLRLESVVRNVEGRVTAGPAGIVLRNPRTKDMCDAPVMLNGDVTLTLPFVRFHELYRTSEVEAIEVVLDGRAVPHTFRRVNPNCPVLMIWLRGR